MLGERRSESLGQRTSLKRLVVWALSFSACPDLPCPLALYLPPYPPLPWFSFPQFSPTWGLFE